MTHPAARRPPPRAFTLLEVAIVVVIIATIASLAFVALAKVIKSSRDAAQRQTIMSLKQGVDHFKQQFEFLPPLVNDNGRGGPVDPLTFNPIIRDAAFLRYEPGTNPADPRYSVYSLPYYLMGVLDVKFDGVAGPGFTRPDPDGSFHRRGKTYEPFFDTSGDPERLVRDPSDINRVTLVDRWKNPIRYYRWMPRFVPGGANQGQVQNYNVPAELRDPAGSAQQRDAEFAIVSAGADGVIDRSGFAATDNRDNIVEIGR